MFKFKRLLIVALFVVGAIILPGLVGAETLPEAGESFNEATLLELNNNYTGNKIGKDAKRFFKVEGIEPGQLLTIAANLNTDFNEQGIELTLYNMDREELDYENDQYNPKVSWMPDSSQDSYSYYLKLKTGQYAADEVDFDLSTEKENYYDGESGTDAGDEITKAIDLSTTTITGYLSGHREGESDTVDFYKTEIEEGKMISLRMIPPTEAWGSIDIYDSDRELLKEESTSNKGQIAKLDFVPEETGEYFIALKSNSDNNELVEYTLESEIKEATDEATEEATETESTPSQDQMPSEEEVRDIQNKIENKIKGEGEEEGWIDMVRGMVFDIIKYVAIILGSIILVIIVIIILIKKGKSGKEKPSTSKEKEKSKEKPKTKESPQKKEKKEEE